MNEYLRISLLIAILLYYVFIFHLLKKDSLNLKYTLLWLLTGLVLLVTVLFPVVLKYPLKKMGVVEWTNGIFALVLFFLILICITITSIVSKLNDRNRKLTQKCALYEKRIRELEKKVFGEDIKETEE